MFADSFTIGKQRAVVASPALMRRVVALPEIEYKQREAERVHRRTLLLDTLLAGDKLERSDGQPPHGMDVPDDSVPSGPVLQLAFKCSSLSSEPWSTSVVADQPLVKIIPDLRSALGLASDTTLQLYFDGAPLDTSRSPQQLQLEDDDLLDVRTAKR